MYDLQRFKTLLRVSDNIQRSFIMAVRSPCLVWASSALVRSPGVLVLRSVSVSVLADDRLFCMDRLKNSGSVSDDGLTLPLSCCLAFSDRRKVSGLCSVLYGLGRKEAVKKSVSSVPGLPCLRH